MLKEFALFVKYPYTAGIIATMWLGTAILFVIKQGLPIVTVLGVNMVASLVLAGIGFRGKKEL